MSQFIRTIKNLSHHPFEEFVESQIWVQRIPLRFFGLQIGTRMTVVRMDYGELFVHSPTRLDSFTLSEL